MDINQAIELIEMEIKKPSRCQADFAVSALKLGIEALTLVKLLRETSNSDVPMLFHGETPIIYNKDLDYNSGIKVKEDKMTQYMIQGRNIDGHWDEGLVGNDADANTFSTCKQAEEMIPNLVKIFANDENPATAIDFRVVVRPSTRR